MATRSDVMCKQRIDPVLLQEETGLPSENVMNETFGRVKLEAVLNIF